jgi:hypothetical protein
MLLADGLDEAFIGVGRRCGQKDVAVYSIPKAIDLLVTRDGMTAEDAEEYLEFNSIGAWVGDETPIWMEAMDMETCMERE